ncbi:MAG: N-acetyltransferase family protein [Actinomycetota bacterium]
MEGVTVRLLRDADADAFGALHARAVAAGDLLASSDPHGDWTLQYALRDPEGVAVADANGRLVGFSLPGPKVTVVEPSWRRRGIARMLIDAVAEIEGKLGNDLVIMGVLPDDDGARAFVEATGFAYHSTVWDLELGPGVPVVPPAWPEGVRARPIERSRDLPAWVALFNASFAAHPTPLQMRLGSTVAEWGKPFPERDDDIVVAMGADGTMLGFCCTDPARRPDGARVPRGEIWTIGVRPDLQGRGIGRQLLRWGVARLRSIGVERVSLAVNGRNPRALGLYESEGFVRAATRDRWSRPVPTLDPPAAPAG